MGYRIGIDVGGTFTDCVAIDGAQQLFSRKTHTVPADETAGIFNGLEEIARHFGVSLRALLTDTEALVLGTTAVTNTMLEFNGVNTGVITTKGFRDVIELRRG